MKGVKPSSVTATGCDKAVKSDRMKAKCANQTCKSGGKKCTYWHNPPYLARNTMAYALRTYSNKLKKNQNPDEDIIEDSD
jgi:hypothetical protein